MNGWDEISVAKRGGKGSCAEIANQIPLRRIGGEGAAVLIRKPAGLLQNPASNFTIDTHLSSITNSWQIIIGDHFGLEVTPVDQPKYGHVAQFHGCPDIKAILTSLNKCMACGGKNPGNSQLSE